MLSNSIRRSLLLIAAAVAVPTGLFAESLAVSQWKFTNPIVDGFSTIRASIDTGANAITLQPNVTTPHQCFGWVEGPRITVPKPSNTSDGNIFQLKVGYTFNQNYSGTAPEMRLRINSANFDEYANSAATSGRFNILRGTGRGTVTATFDRRNLTADNSVRLYIDLFASAGVGQVDPNFYVRIESIEVFTINAGAAPGLGDQITAAYMDEDQDLYVHVNNAGEGDRRRVRSDVDTYAYDGGYIVAIDDGGLYGFKASDSFNSIEIEDSDVVIAAVSQENVVYANEDGEFHYFNLETKERRELGDSGDNYVYLGAGANGTILVYRYDDDTRGPYRIYQLNPRNLAAGLQRLVDYDALGRGDLYIRTRTTAIYTGGKKNADLWTLQ